jgi:prepilin-type N-terminal cleavage/methylation domain-containing protein
VKIISCFAGLAITDIMKKTIKSASANISGYSLVEVLIASVIIGIAIVSVFQAISNGTRISRQDFLMRRAYQHLEQILEKPENSYKGSHYVNAVENNLGTLTSGTHDLGNVLLDDRDTPGISSDDLNGSAMLIIENLDMTATIAGIPSSKCCNNVMAKKLTAKIIWSEGGQTDTASLETIVSLVNSN